MDRVCAKLIFAPMFLFRSYLRTVAIQVKIYQMTSSHVMLLAQGDGVPVLRATLGGVTGLRWGGGTSL